MSSVEDRIKDALLRAAGNLLPGEPLGRQPQVALDRIRAVLETDEALELMARAADAEESAQKGEPDPWRGDLMKQYEDEQGLDASVEWQAERRAAMRCALRAVGLA